jgi:HEAT repeat protein
VRRAAIDVIASRPHADAAPLIVCALKDPDGSVVRTACQAAASLEIREAHDDVVALLASPDAGTREVALAALRALGDADDFERVFEVVRRDPSERVRKAAAWVLRDHVATRTWRPLFDAWHHDPIPRHRVWACEIAAEFGRADVALALSAMKDDPDGHVRRAAAIALSSIAGDSGRSADASRR